MALFFIRLITLKANTLRVEQDKIYEGDKKTQIVKKKTSYFKIYV